MKDTTKMTLTAAGLAAVAVLLVGCISTAKEAPVEVQATRTGEPITVTTLPAIKPTESRTEPPTTEAQAVAYDLTAEERDLVERVVMAEAGGEEELGQLMVAQCILNACELDGIRPAEVVEHYQYAQSRPDPSEQVREAVASIFDDGVEVVDPETVYFYAPARCVSEWHETQAFVVEVDGHRFFKAKED